MDASTQKKNAQAFAERWCEHGDEKQETQRFWIDLLQSVYGVEDAARVIEFEKRVRLSHTSFIEKGRENRVALAARMKRPRLNDKVSQVAEH